MQMKFDSSYLLLDFLEGSKLDFLQKNFFFSLLLWLFLRKKTHRLTKHLGMYQCWINIESVHLLGMDISLLTYLSTIFLSMETLYENYSYI